MPDEVGHWENVLTPAQVHECGHVMFWRASATFVREREDIAYRLAIVDGRRVREGTLLARLIVQELH